MKPKEGDVNSAYTNAAIENVLHFCADVSHKIKSRKSFQANDSSDSDGDDETITQDFNVQTLNVSTHPKAHFDEGEALEVAKA